MPAKRDDGRINQHCATVEVFMKAFESLINWYLSSEWRLVGARRARRIESTSVPTTATATTTTTTTAAAAL